MQARYASRNMIGVVNNHLTMPFENNLLISQVRYPLNIACNKAMLSASAGDGMPLNKYVFAFRTCSSRMHMPTPKQFSSLDIAASIRCISCNHSFLVAASGKCHNMS